MADSVNGLTKGVRMVTSNHIRDRVAETRIMKTPDHDDVIQWLKDAIRAHGDGDLDIAEQLYRKVLQHHPELGIACNNFGLVLKAKGKVQAAIASFRRAMRVDPSLKQAYLNLGITLKDQGNRTEALDLLHQAIVLDPDYGDAYYNMGLVLAEMGHLKRALASYWKAIQLQPNPAQAYNNNGIILQELGRTREAIRCFQEAVRLAPDNAMAHYNLGVLYKFHGDVENAVRCVRSALDVMPQFSDARAELTSQLRDLCDWDGMAGLGEVACQSDNDSALVGFPELHPGYLSSVLEDARKRSQSIASRATAVKHRIAHRSDHWRDGKGPLVIGYLSGNFRDHPTAHLLCDMFACHDRRRFRIDCYSYGESDHSDYRKKIETTCDRFVDLFDTGSLEAAHKIRSNQVAILIDLNGHTACNRMDICSFRPAPVQARYLGAAKTSGASFMDYLIGDHIITPESHAAYYAEKLVWMPNTYQINSNPEYTAPDHLDGRRKYLLPIDGVVFCSFVTSYKIDPELFACWLRLLHRVPGSVLWLLKRSGIVENHLKRRAAANGIDPDRLVFADAVPKSEHLGRLALADLCLDTRAVNGAATTSDALWAGVPVITMKGGHFVSNMSQSILNAVGMPEMVARDLEQYEELAVDLASNPMRLTKVRETLAENRLREPLFDTRRFVCNLEYAFERMWENYLEKEKPRHIDVSDCGPSALFRRAE